MTNAIRVLTFAVLGGMGLWSVLAITACSDSSGSAPVVSRTSTGNTGVAKEKTASTTTKTDTGTKTATTPTTDDTTPAEPVAPTVSGKVTRSASTTGKGTLCLAIGNVCVSMQAVQSGYTPYMALSLPNTDFTASGATKAFSFEGVEGKLTAGTTYVVTAMLQAAGGECWKTGRQGDLFSWEESASNSPCAKFTYQGDAVGNLSVDLNSIVPFSFP